MNRMRTVLVLLGLLIAGSSAHAQAPRVKADIPFPFVVGNHVLPAGEYVVSRDNILTQVITIRPATGKGGMFVSTNACESSDPSGSTKLIFDTLGGQYFLSQIWTEGNNRGLQLPKSEAEIEMAKNHNPTREVTITASLVR